MTSLESEILEMYENLDMSVDDIACSSRDQDDPLDPIAIKTILAQYSHKYRTNGRKLATLESKGIKSSHTNPKAPSPANNTKNFLSETEQAELVEVMKSLALNSDSDIVRAKMSIYLFEEDKGRNEARIKNLSNMKPNGVNILVLNQRLVSTQARIEALRQKAQIKDRDSAIEIESVKSSC